MYINENSPILIFNISSIAIYGKIKFTIAIVEILK